MKKQLMLLSLGAFLLASAVEVLATRGATSRAPARRAASAPVASRTPAATRAPAATAGVQATTVNINSLSDVTSNAQASNQNALDMFAAASAYAATQGKGGKATSPTGVAMTNYLNTAQG